MTGLDLSDASIGQARSIAAAARTDVRFIEGELYSAPAEALAWDQDDTYVEVEGTFEVTRNVSWNHGIGEIVTALLDAGLRLTMLVEHDTVPGRPCPAACRTLAMANGH